MQDFLFNKFNIQASITTIRCVLEAAQWSRKAVFKCAAQQSASLRYTWQSRQKEWLADQLIFLDESASNERTGNRKQNWAPVGADCEVLTPYKRSER